MALTSHLTHCFEKLIRKQFTECLEVNILYNTNQHSFWVETSCLSQLPNQQNQRLEALCANKASDGLYTNFAKAFCKCNYRVIAPKLWQIKILSQISRWIYNFLMEIEKEKWQNKSENKKSIS